MTTKPDAHGSHTLVAGATGYIGRDVVRELIARGIDVTATIRSGSDLRPDQSVVDSALQDARCIEWRIASDADAPDPGDNPPDTIVSCLASRTGVAQDAWHVDYGGNLKLLRWAQAHGVRRFVLLSAICVQKPRLAFQFAKLKFEQALAESGLEYAIVRPTAYYKSLAGQIDRVRGGKPFLVFGNGELTACKPISAMDLARFIADQVQAPTPANDVLPIGGPENAITPLEQGALLFELTGREPRYKRVPPAMFRVAQALLAPLAWLLPPVRAKAELARIGHYYATESMLLWDEAEQRYAADRTPSYGSDTLRAFYASALRDGLEGQDPGAQKLFSRSSSR